MIALELIRQAVPSSILVDVPTIMLNILFVFGFVPKSGMVWAGWTVGVEMVFYEIFPVLLLLLKTPRQALYFLIAALAIGYASRYVLHEQFLSTTPTDRLDWSKKTFVSNLYFFAIGIYAFKLKECFNENGLALRRLIPTFSLVVITMMLFVDDYSELNSGRPDLMIWALGFGALCIWQSTYPSHFIASKIFQYLGERSYSIYLLHPVVIYYSKSQITTIYDSLFFNIGSGAFFVCAFLVFIIVMILAEFTYRFIELPGINVGKKLIMQKKVV